MKKINRLTHKRDFCPTINQNELRVKVFHETVRFHLVVPKYIYPISLALNCSNLIFLSTKELLQDDLKKDRNEAILRLYGWDRNFKTFLRLKCHPLSRLWASSKWLVRYVKQGNAFRQIEHWKGFSRVCSVSCTIRFAFDSNVRPQYLQGKPLSVDEFEDSDVRSQSNLSPTESFLKFNCIMPFNIKVILTLKW